MIAEAPLGVRTRPEGFPTHTLAGHVFAWCNDYLLQPDGPDAGAPWVFTPEQAHFVDWWYAVDERGRFIYRYGLLRRMKGWGKDPVGAALCCVECLGPCRFDGWDKGRPLAQSHQAAWVQTAAVSKDQTRNTMTLFPGMLSPKAIEDYRVDMGKEIIYAMDGRRRIEAVTSSPRALEGQRATFVLKNETHLWFESNEGHEMAAVIARNLAKSRDGAARALSISNAYAPGQDSDAERDNHAWLEIEEGHSRATGFLMDSLEAPPDTDLSDPESLACGIASARGDSKWIDIERVMDEIYDPRSDPATSRRFYLNQITAEEDSWCAPHEWDACARPTLKLRKGDQIALGFDGSLTDDHTPLVACRVEDSALFTLGLWVPGPNKEVPRLDVHNQVVRSFKDYDVVAFYADVRWWETYIDKWEQEIADDLCVHATNRHPIAYDMRNRQREVTQASEAFLAAIKDRDVLHEGKPYISQYIYNAKRRPNAYGVTFAKESPDSAKKVDWAAAALLARKARQDYLALPDERKRQKKGWHGIYIPGVKV